MARIMRGLGTGVWRRPALRHHGDRRDTSDALDPTSRGSPADTMPGHLAHRLRMAGVPAAKSANARRRYRRSTLVGPRVVSLRQRPPRGTTTGTGAPWRMSRNRPKSHGALPISASTTDYVLHEILQTISNGRRTADAGRHAWRWSPAPAAASALRPRRHWRPGRRGGAAGPPSRSTRSSSKPTSNRPAEPRCRCPPTSPTPSRSRPPSSAPSRSLGRLDTLVNNAGRCGCRPAAEAPCRTGTTMVSVNIQGVLYVTRAAIPHLIDAAADSTARRLPIWSPSAPPPAGSPGRVPPSIR